MLRSGNKMLACSTAHPRRSGPSLAVAEREKSLDTRAGPVPLRLVADNCYAIMRDSLASLPCAVSRDARPGRSLLGQKDLGGRLAQHYRSLLWFIQ